MASAPLSGAAIEAEGGWPAFGITSRSSRELQEWLFRYRHGSSKLKVELLKQLFTLGEDGFRVVEAVARQEESRNVRQEFDAVAGPGLAHIETWMAEGNPRKAEAYAFLGAGAGDYEEAYTWVRFHLMMGDLKEKIRTLPHGRSGAADGFCMSVSLASIMIGDYATAQQFMPAWLSEYPGTELAFGMLQKNWRELAAMPSHQNVSSLDLSLSRLAMSRLPFDESLETMGRSGSDEFGARFVARIRNLVKVRPWKNEKLVRDVGRLMLNDRPAEALILARGTALEIPLLLESGRYEEALQVWRESRDRGATVTTADLELFPLFLRLGANAEAREIWQRADAGLRIEENAAPPADDKMAERQALVLRKRRGQLTAMEVALDVAEGHIAAAEAIVLRETPRTGWSRMMPWRPMQPLSELFGKRGVEATYWWWLSSVRHPEYDAARLLAVARELLAKPARDAQDAQSVVDDTLLHFGADRIPIYHAGDHLLELIAGVLARSGYPEAGLRLLTDEALNPLRRRTIESLAEAFARHGQLDLLREYYTSGPGKELLPLSAVLCAEMARMAGDTEGEARYRKKAEILVIRDGLHSDDLGECVAALPPMFRAEDIIVRSAETYFPGLEVWYRLRFQWARVATRHGEWAKACRLMEQYSLSLVDPFPQGYGMWRDPAPATQGKFRARVAWLRARADIAAKDYGEAVRAATFAAHVAPYEMQFGIDCVNELDRAHASKEADAVFEASFRPLQQAAEAFPRSALLADAVAWLCAGCHRNLDEGLRFAELACALAPRDSDQQLTLAEVRRRRGEFDLAHAAAQRSMDSLPDPVTAELLKRVAARDSASLPIRRDDSPLAGFGLLLDQTP